MVRWTDREGISRASLGRAARNVGSSIFTIGWGKNSTDTAINEFHFSIGPVRATRRINTETWWTSPVDIYGDGRTRSTRRSMDHHWEVQVFPRVHSAASKARGVHASR